MDILKNANKRVKRKKIQKGHQMQNTIFKIDLCGT